MEKLIFMAIAGIIFGLSLAFNLMADQLKASNEIGNSKCGRLDYLTTFHLFAVKDDVPRSLDIDEM